MNAFKTFAVATLLGLGATTSAQTAAPQTTVRNVHVYMVGKQDAQHVIISEVMEVPSNTTREELLARVRTAHPGVTIPESTEGVESSSAAAAKKSRDEMRATYERSGRSVTMLEAKK